LRLSGVGCARAIVVGIDRRPGSGPALRRRRWVVVIVILDAVDLFVEIGRQVRADSFLGLGVVAAGLSGGDPVKKGQCSQAQQCLIRMFFIS